MSLRKLATFPIIDGQTGLPASEFAFCQSSQTTAITSWVHYKGLGIVTEFEGNTRGIVALDGITQSVGNRVLSRFGWWADVDRMVFTDNFLEYHIDNRGMGIRTVQISPGTFNPGGGSGVFFAQHTTYLKVRDRWYWYNEGIRSRAAGDTEDRLDHPSFGSHFDEFGQSLSWAGRGPGEMFVASDDLPIQAAFYNTVTQQLSSRILYFPEGLRRVTYVPEHGIIAALTAYPYSIEIYALETHPIALSEPEVLSGSVAQGHVAVFRVRATGDLGDACEGELINWSITGEGTLLDTQTTTDADGYATARVRYIVAASGDSTIEARLVC